MHLDQLAYYAHNEAQVLEIKRMFGLENANWVEDIAEGNVYLQGSRKPKRSRAHLRFNYDLGVELEILTYLDGAHWHLGKDWFLDRQPAVSHIGFHMNDGELPPPHVLQHGNLVQVMDTDRHTNDYVTSRGRTYHYKIYEMPFGPDLKYIWRMQP